MISQNQRSNEKMSVDFVFRPVFFPCLLEVFRATLKLCDTVIVITEEGMQIEALLFSRNLFRDLGRTLERATKNRA